MAKVPWPRSLPISYFPRIRDCVLLLSFLFIDLTLLSKSAIETERFLISPPPWENGSNFFFVRDRLDWISKCWKFSREFWFDYREVVEEDDLSLFLSSLLFVVSLFLCSVFSVFYRNRIFFLFFFVYIWKLFPSLLYKYNLTLLGL